MKFTQRRGDAKVRRGNQSLVRHLACDSSFLTCFTSQKCNGSEYLSSYLCLFAPLREILQSSPQENYVAASTGDGALGRDEPLSADVSAITASTSIASARTTSSEEIANRMYVIG